MAYQRRFLFDQWRNLYGPWPQHFLQRLVQFSAVAHMVVFWHQPGFPGAVAHDQFVTVPAGMALDGAVRILDLDNINGIAAGALDGDAQQIPGPVHLLFRHCKLLRTIHNNFRLIVAQFHLAGDEQDIIILPEISRLLVDTREDGHFYLTVRVFDDGRRHDVALFGGDAPGFNDAPANRDLLARP